LEDKADKEAFLALELVQTGLGGRVVVMREGAFARIVFYNNDIPGQAVITAAINEIDIKSDQSKLKCPKVKNFRHFRHL
jgi:microcompartment protein CcmK/EutM